MTSKQILPKVCSIMNISVKDIQSNSNKPKLVNARMIYAIICRDFTRESTAVVAKRIKKNRTSVSYYSRVFNNYILTDNHLKEYYDITRRIMIQDLAKDYEESIETNLVEQIDFEVNKLLKIKNWIISSKKE
tara:strand:+ start:543 stop:938 length:396 start_codon:yes stop_codon:yes gene_type:complete